MWINTSDREALETHHCGNGFWLALLAHLNLFLPLLHVGFCIFWDTYQFRIRLLFCNSMDILSITLNKTDLHLFYYDPTYADSETLLRD